MARPSPAWFVLVAALGLVATPAVEPVRVTRTTGTVTAPTAVLHGRPTVIGGGRLAWNGRSGLAYRAHLDGDYVVLSGGPGHTSILSPAVGQQ